MGIIRNMNTKSEFVEQMARVSERNSGAPEWAQEHRQGQASYASAAPVKDKKEMEPRVPVATDCHGVAKASRPTARPAPVFALVSSDKNRIIKQQRMIKK